MGSVSRCPGHWRTVALSLALVLCACSSQPPQPAQEPAPDPVPAEVELNLSLPQTGQCPCPPAETVDHTFLERGLNALAADEHIEAVQYFQRFQRLEKTALADWEADLAIAYVSVLPASPFYDLEAARASWRELQTRRPSDADLHPQIALLSDTMQAVVALLRQLDELRQSNQTLSEELDKREQALKRLRDLTLGQQRGVRP